MERVEKNCIYWWAYPSRVVLFVHLPLLLLCAVISEADYAVYQHKSKFLTGSALFIAVAGLLAFAIAAIPSEPLFTTGPRMKQLDAAKLRRAIGVLAFLVLSAYAIFLFPVLAKPQIVLELISGSSSAMFSLRETLNHIPGLTSFMALQSLLLILILSYRQLTGEAMPAGYLTIIAATIIACFLRAWLWSERLALIELALPFIILRFSPVAPQWREVTFAPLALAPLAGAIALALLFAAGEYFRSWQYYQYRYSGTFAEFIAVRLAGYYATALNNGAALITLVDPFMAPLHTAQWIAKFPLWEWLGIDPGADGFNTMNFLESYLNPEFNNMGGIFLPIADFGIVLGLICWAVMGWISGRLFNAFALGRISGLLLYPVWFTGIVEILRVFYWGETRFFPMLLGGLVVTWFLGGFAHEEADCPLPDAAVAPN